jgi:nitrite reductase (NADH) small subunit
MTEWLEICHLDQIPRLGARVWPAPGGNISLFRTSDDRVFALDDRCPHRGGPLSQGIVHGHFVTCPLHDFVIDLTNGRAVAPDKGCTAHHAVRIEHGMVMVLLAPAKSAIEAA